MDLTPQEIRGQFLNSIMNENRVSLKAVYECMSENGDTIDNMDSIFDSEDEVSMRKCMVLLHIISRDQAQENLSYFFGVEKAGTDSIGSYIDQYKVLMITALMFNTLFYVSACNWCGLIQREVKILKKQGRGTPFSAHDTWTKIIRFPEPRHDAVAAARLGFSSFHEIPLSCDDTQGRLYFKGNDQQEVILEFRFEKIPPEAVPFELEVCFTTKHDQKEHTVVISADSYIEGTNIIKSGIISDIYYSDGISGEYTVKVKQLNFTVGLDNSK